MSPSRTGAVATLDLQALLKRPLVWSLVAVLLLLSWGLSTGSVTIAAGSATVGGRKAWITSEFSIAFVLTILIGTLYVFFVSIAAGMAVISDDESKVSELLHATRLRPGEYIWGKALALLGAFALVLALHLGLMMLFNHVIPDPEALDVRGPFDSTNYLRPAFIFAVPLLVFFTGVSFYLGARTRRPAVAFLFPLGTLLFLGLFLWNWTPTWIDPSIDRWLMWIDPAGVRWLDQTWLAQDRGADFYNTTRIGLDLPFGLSRLAFLGLGLLAIAGAHRHFARTFRSPGRARRRLRKHAPSAATRSRAAVIEAKDLAGLRMSGGKAAFWRDLGRFALAEAGAIYREPALYIFGVFIVAQTLGTTLLSLGAFDTPLLLTPGGIAAGQFNTLTLLLALLLMLFLVESLERERSSGIEALVYSSPTRTASLLLGKALGAGLAGLAVVAAVFGGGLIALTVQGRVGFDLVPYLLVWGLLLTPTSLAWLGFVAAVQAALDNRYLTYGIGLGVIALTLYLQFTDGLTWASNWMMWGALNWSDISTLELDRTAILLNRLMVLSLAALFFLTATNLFRRRRPDIAALLHRLRPKSLLRRARPLLPAALVTLVLFAVLWLEVMSGFAGEAADEEARDYWKQNYATWKDAPQPSLRAVELRLDLQPDESRFSTRGTYRLVNHHDEALDRFALSGGRHWRDVRWTLKGERYTPEDRSGLFAFEPATPLASGAEIEVGFDFRGRWPDGISENGGSPSEFILPSGVVLTSFSTSFAPVLGFVEGRGVEEENEMEPPDYALNRYKRVLPPLFGNERPFTTRLTISGPAELSYNSVGMLEEERVEAGQRTAVWVSDEPVPFFNVVAGRWAAREGEGTTIYYHPGHDYNIDEMAAVLEGARHWYSEWFYPYPWKRLKLSEFPGLATYAQGFPTNITFSESIGFLTEPDPRTHTVALVTAHESAHQWWGNLLRPGNGPGGNVLSEGMAHFSTALLLEQLKGPQARMAFLRRIEERYGEGRRVDDERPLVRIDGERPGDRTVTYDKGGWVAWMMMHLMGQEAFLEGLRTFIARYKDGPDYPLLQDLIDTLRPFAPEIAAFELFVAQWFFDVVAPEYRLSEARAERSGGAWIVRARVTNIGTGRMPVEVAAVSGDRFDSDGVLLPDYREALTEVVLGAGESRTIEIRTRFEPERLVVDPSVRVLQLRRSHATAEF